MVCGLESKRPNQGMQRYSTLTRANITSAETKRLCIDQHVPRANRLVGLVDKTSASTVGDPGFESHLRRDFSGSSHTSDFKTGTPGATLPGAWRYRVSAGTGRPGVSIL